MSIHVLWLLVNVVLLHQHRAYEESLKHPKTLQNPLGMKRRSPSAKWHHISEFFSKKFLVVRSPFKKFLFAVRSIAFRCKDLWKNTSIDLLLSCMKNFDGLHNYPTENETCLTGLINSFFYCVSLLCLLLCFLLYGSG